MQWKKHTGARRNDFQIAGRKTGQRSRRACRYCKRTPSRRNHIGGGTKDWNLFSSFATKKLMATSITNAASTEEKLLRARQAAGKLALLSTQEKNAFLLRIADAIEANLPTILAANQEDIESSGLEDALRDRLLLTPERIKKMAQRVSDVAALADPIGQTLPEWTPPTRQSVQDLIKARGLVDVIIPSGGAGLIAFVSENSAVPVIETGAGNCHIFVDESAEFGMADQIVINAKTQRPSVCNAAEKLLVHERIAAEYVPRIVKKLIDAGMEVRGDGKSRSLRAERG